MRVCNGAQMAAFSTPSQLAAQSVVEAERDKLSKLQALMDNLSDSLNNLP